MKQPWSSPGTVSALGLIIAALSVALGFASSPDELGISPDSENYKRIAAFVTAAIGVWRLLNSGATSIPATAAAWLPAPNAPGLWLHMVDGIASVIDVADPATLAVRGGDWLHLPPLSKPAESAEAAAFSKALALLNARNESFSKGQAELLKRLESIEQRVKNVA